MSWRLAPWRTSSRRVKSSACTSGEDIVKRDDDDFDVVYIYYYYCCSSNILLHYYYNTTYYIFLLQLSTIHRQRRWKSPTNFPSIPADGALVPTNDLKALAHSQHMHMCLHTKLSYSLVPWRQTTHMTSSSSSHLFC